VGVPEKRVGGPSMPGLNRLGSFRPPIRWKPLSAIGAVTGAPRAGIIAAAPAPAAPAPANAADVSVRRFRKRSPSRARSRRMLMPARPPTTLPAIVPAGAVSLTRLETGVRVDVEVGAVPDTELPTRPDALDVYTTPDDVKTIADDPAPVVGAEVSDVGVEPRVLESAAEYDVLIVPVADSKEEAADAAGNNVATVPAEFADAAESLGEFSDAEVAVAAPRLLVPATLPICVMNVVGVPDNVVDIVVSSGTRPATENAEAAGFGVGLATEANGRSAYMVVDDPEPEDPTGITRGTAVEEAPRVTMPEYVTIFARDVGEEPEEPAGDEETGATAPDKIEAVSYTTDEEPRYEAATGIT